MRALALAALMLALPLAAQAQTFSTYLGGQQQERAYGVTVHPNGKIYVVGSAISDGLGKSGGAGPTLNLMRAPGSGSGPGTNDGYVASYLPGGRLEFFTYLGNLPNNWSASVNAIAVNGDGKLVVAGYAGSIPHGATGIGTVHGQTDAFVALIEPTGTGSWTFAPIGGMLGESALGVAIRKDPASGKDTYYLTGWTASTDLTGALNACSGCAVPSHNADAFVAKFDDQLHLVASRYLGAPTGYTFAKGIAIGPQGEVVITGLTTASGLATANVGFPEGKTGGVGPDLSDAFVARFDSNLSQLEFFCYLGGENQEGGVGELHYTPEGIAVDGQGNVYVTGVSTSYSLRKDAGPHAKLFPTKNAIPKSATPGPYVAKLRPEPGPMGGYNLDWSTCLGTHVGTSDARGLALRTDSRGETHVWVTGMVGHSPAAGDAALLAKNGNPSQPGQNAFLAELDANGNLEYASCLAACPATEDVRSMGLAFTSSGKPVIVGTVRCGTLLPSPLVPHSGDSDAFVWTLP